MAKIPLIFDCDPGVDDSFAFSLLAAHPDKIDLIGVTPVEGNVPAELTRRNALALCQAFGLDCPVAFGADKPLRRAYFQTAANTHGESGVGDLVFDDITKAPIDLPAWEFIYREAVRLDGQLVLLAVGPLTNIATALRLHPDLPRYIKALYIMGGGTFGNVSSTNKTAEFNIWIDPTAAREVFEQMEVRMVGLNATHAAAVSAADFDRMIELCGDSETAAIPRGLASFSKRNAFEHGQDNNAIHDALTAACLIDPAVVTFEHKHVHVIDDDDAPNLGQTVILEPDGAHPANAYVAMAVDQPRFVQMILDMCAYHAKK